MSKKISQLTEGVAQPTDEIAVRREGSNFRVPASSVGNGIEVTGYSETVVIANSGAAYAANLANGNIFELTLTDNCVLTFSNPPASGKAGSATLILHQDGTGSRTITWPDSVVWALGFPPTLSTAAGATDILQLFTTNGGTTWYAFMAGANMI